MKKVLSLIFGLQFFFSNLIALNPVALSNRKPQNGYYILMTDCGQKIDSVPKLNYQYHFSFELINEDLHSGYLFRTEDSSVIIAKISGRANSQDIKTTKLPISVINYIHYRNTKNESKGYFIGSVIGGILGLIVPVVTLPSPTSKDDFLFFRGEYLLFLGFTVSTGATGGAILGGELGRSTKVISILGNQSKYEEQREKLRSMGATEF